MDLRSRYLGLELDNPFVPSSTPLSKNLDSARQLEDAGASALVMHSLFQEEIEAGSAETPGAQAGGDLFGGAHNLASKELLALLKAAGLKRTAFGVESGDPEILKSIDKKVDHDTIRWAFQNAKDVGLETIAFLIIGLPGETRETMQRTIDFAIELDPLIANFSMMTPYPGTKVYEIIKRQGRFLINDWEDYVFFEQKARYEMGEMTAELVEEMYRKAYRQYYLRPAPVTRRVKTKDFWLNLPRNMRIAANTFVPKKEKTGLRKAVEAEGAI